MLILELQSERWIVNSHLMLVLVFRMLRYWRMSGKVIRRSALRNLRPIQVLEGVCEQFSAPHSQHKI